MPITETSDDVVALLQAGDAVETDEGPGTVTGISLHGAEYDGEWQLEPPSVAVLLEDGRTIHTCLCTLKLQDPEHTELLHQEFERLWPPMDGVPEDAEDLIPEGQEDEIMRYTTGSVDFNALDLLDRNIGAREVPSWDNKVLDHLNYQDAYEGEVEELNWMVAPITTSSPEDADELISIFDLQTEPSGPEDDHDPSELWEEVIQDLAQKKYRTYYAPHSLPAGIYELGVVGDQFGFYFHADGLDMYTLRDFLYPEDEEDEDDY
jgi:hypothetical protein